MSKEKSLGDSCDLDFILNFNPDKIVDREEKNHINIYSKSKHKLGRMLSNFYHCNVKTDHGTFCSVEGYWYWLGCRDDKLRTLYGYEAKKYGKRCEQISFLPEGKFRNYIKKAISFKIILNKNILQEFIKSTLPFDHYYVFDDKIVRPEKYTWLVEYHTFYRNFLKNIMCKTVKK